MNKVELVKKFEEKSKSVLESYNKLACGKCKGCESFRSMMGELGIFVITIQIGNKFGAVCDMHFNKMMGEILETLDVFEMALKEEDVEVALSSLATMPPGEA